MRQRALLAALYLTLAAYLPISRALSGGASTETWLDRFVPLVPWLGPVYVLGMVPIALLPLFFYTRLPARDFQRYALAVIAGAVVTYLVYFVYPTAIRRPPLPADPLDRYCLGLAYASRSPNGIFPSSHAVYTSLNAWYLCRVAAGFPRATALTASAVIIAAALLTGLHHAADIAAGMALAAAALAVTRLLSKTD